ELADERVGESGPHPADIAPAVSGVGPREQQRAKAAATALWRGIAHHRELVARELLGLAPVVATPPTVGSVRALGNDSFEALLAGQAQGEPWVGIDMAAEGQLRGNAVEQLAEQLLAIDQRGVGHID